MGNFMQYFFQDFGRAARALWDMISDGLMFLYFFLNLGSVSDIIRAHSGDFGVWDWVLVIVVNLLRLAIIIVAIVLLSKLCKRIFRFRAPVKEYDALVKQVKDLQRDLLRANYEKDKLLSMKSEALGVHPDEAPEEDETKDLTESKRNTFQSPCVDPMESRFFRLTTLDNYYKTQYKAPAYETGFTLAEFCDRFRRFSASRLGLYYDISMMRYLVAALATTRIIILQGISGTGKTSLAYAFGKFVGKDTTLVPVQPAWRERTELYGYYNEFTKKYTETEFLSAVYEANYYRDPHLVILDEMNIARVEYYFAEMLSILELPNKEDWKVDIVSAVWDNDPCLIDNGSVHIPDNVWFVGTINNDDSTFAVADKVYDRAVPIDLDSRAEAFQCEDAEPITVSTEYMEELFKEAREQYSLSAETEANLETLNDYLIKNFKLAFGNRIIKQIKDFVPAFMACGGTELEAVDFMVAKKVLRKFESLSLGFMKDELTRFSGYLDKVFGRNQMKICKDYVDYLKKNN